MAGAPRGEPPRVAYAVSRRVGPAVVRNRVRRRLRHALAAHRELLVADGAYLVIPRPGLAEIPHAELRALVADDYADANGRDAADIRNLLHAWLVAHPSVSLLTRIESIELEGTELARVQVTVGMLGRESRDQREIDPLVDDAEVAEARARQTRLLGVLVAGIER